MTTLVRQSSFHGGEIAPNLYSRTDIPARASAVRTLRNFIPTPTGAAQNRPGLQFIVETKDSTRKSRLVPFTFSTDQAYLLEFGNLYVRVYQGGVYVTEVVTPYLEADIWDLHFVQSGDTLTITHMGYAPRELRRTGVSTWVLASFSTAHTATPPNAPTFLQAPITVADATHAVKAWDWVVTCVVNDEESLPSVKLSSTLQLAPDRTVYVGTSAVTGATEYCWYRGRYGTYGYIGNSTEPSFADDGQVPNYGDRPPTARNPFANNENPALATYFQQRLAFANQPSYPQRVLASQTGRFHDFDYSIPQHDSDAIDFTVASLQYEEVRALVPLQQLLVLTANTEFVIDNGDSPVTPTSVRLVPIGYNGCSWLRPIVIHNSVLFVQAQQASVREMVFDGQVGWGGGDLSLSANHLLAASNLSITDWTHQRLPFPTVWAARDDGALLSLTYSREFKTAAWAKHDTDGFVESVCSIPEYGEDAVYAVVRRLVNGVQRRYIERLATRQVTDVKLGCFLDASVFYDGTPLSIFTGLSHLEGKSVLALRDGVPDGPHTVTAGSITLSAPGSKVFIGLSYDSDIELLDLVLGQESEAVNEEKTVARVIWEVDRTAGLYAGESLAALTPWRASLGDVTPASGLSNERFVMPVISSWNRGGRSVLRQSMPLPVTVIGVTREVAVGSA